MTKVTFNMLAYSFCYVFDTNIVSDEPDTTQFY